MGSTPDLDLGCSAGFLIQRRKHRGINTGFRFRNFSFQHETGTHACVDSKEKTASSIVELTTFQFQFSSFWFKFPSFKFQFPSFNFQGRELPHLLEKFGDLVPQTTWETRNQLLQIIYGYGLARLQTQW